MSENDHSKLLMSLLRYQDTNGHYKLLHSFLTRFTKSRGKVNYRYIEKVEIKFNPCYKDGGKRSLIDGLVLFNVGQQRFAIIFENKIFNAVDGKNQIRRYIKHVVGDGVELSHVWVFYLSPDGSKDVDSSSYDVDNEQKTTNIGNRFIPLSYTKDILSWMKEDILEKRIYPESLTSIVREYAQHIEDEFVATMHVDESIKKIVFNCLRIKKSNYKQMTREDIEKFLILNDQIEHDWNKMKNSEDNQDSNETQYQELNSLRDILRNIKKEMESVAFYEILEQTTSIFNEIFKPQKKGLSWQVSMNAESKNHGYYIQVRIVEEKNSAHWEWCHLTIADMICGAQNYNFELHLEGFEKDNLREVWRNEFQNQQDKSGFITGRKRTIISIKNPLKNIKLVDVTREQLEALYKSNIVKTFSDCLINEKDIYHVQKD